jgi:AraC family transcriptional regulator, regulatory protein of adaptative response / methylated-DNA-[protein]-cysteine methyltransferase
MISAFKNGYEGAGTTMIMTVKIESPLGSLTAGATDEGVCLLEFSDMKRVTKEMKELSELLDSSFTEGDNNHLQALRRELDEYFTGKRKVFTIQLVTPGTPFQQAVWQELVRIPFGSTRSYHEQAVALDMTESVRAVANANGMNRIAIIIPCHRVIGSDGRLTGYGGGLARKKWLIDHEKKYSGKAFDMTLF